MEKYINCICERELKIKLESFGAVHIVGPKWCGKTTTAKQYEKAILNFKIQIKVKYI